MNYCFIDESGDSGFTKKSSRYFILSAVVCDDPDTLRRIARKVFHSKIKKKHSNMLHAYSESDTIKNKLTKVILEKNVSCITCKIDKTTVCNDIDIYLYATAKIAEYFEDKDTEIIVVSKQDTRKSYNKRVENI